MIKIYLLLVVIYTHLSCGRRTRYLDRNIDLVSSISPTQAVEEGSSVELECRLGNVPDRAEVAWVKLRGLGEATYLATYRKEEGVMDYEEEFTSEMEKDGDEAVWSLTLYRVTKSMAGFYQCEVRYVINSIFPFVFSSLSYNRCVWCQRRQVLAGISMTRLITSQA